MQNFPELESIISAFISLVKSNVCSLFSDINSLDGNLVKEGFGGSNYVTVIQNIGNTSTIQLHPTLPESECVWLVVAMYPTSTQSQVFVCNRSGNFNIITGSDPIISKVDTGNGTAGDNGNIKIALAFVYPHVIVIGTQKTTVIK